MVSVDTELFPVKTQIRLAVAMVLVSGFFNSFGGLILRSVEEASEWQIVFYRAGSLSLGLIAVFVVRNFGRVGFKVKQIGIWGCVGGVWFCSMQTLFIFSLSHTTVANTVFILGSAPILTAVAARLILGERISSATWGMLIVAVSGLAMMFAAGVSAGNTFGDLAAIGSTLSFVGFIIVLRAKRKVDMLPSLIVGALLASSLAFVSTGGDVAVPTRDLVLCVLWGGVISSGVLVLFTAASRHLKGGVLTTLLTIEYVLGPFWVWLFIDEQPSVLTLAGGAVVICGVIGQVYLAGRPKSLNINA